MSSDLQTVGRGKLAEQITGGLSITQKMPAASWGVPASRCSVGSGLVHVEGSTCSACYALKGRYRFPNVQRKLEERYQGLQHELWTPAMVYLIRWYCDRYFRWFDSGDLVDENHLRNIDTVARHTEGVRHWLPTREYSVVREVEQLIGQFSENLTIRVSAHMLDSPPPDWWPTTSTVDTKTPKKSHGCPSLDQGNSCQSCRACWDPAVQNISYRRH